MMKFLFLRCLIFGLFFLPYTTSYGLQIYRTGNPLDVTPDTRLGACLAGGGDDAKWVKGWKFLLNKANGGDLIFIRADGARGDYENWLYNDPDNLNLPKVNSVSTLSLEKASDAHDTRVVENLEKAELVFFVGGDQSLYIEWFRNSPLIKTVEALIRKKKIPVAGTSAGMALLAGIDFAARLDSPNAKDGMVTSEDVLNDPFGEFVDLDSSVLIPPYLEDVITDTHFSERNRQGRLVGFLSKAAHSMVPDSGEVKAIAADEGTAVCYHSDGQARVFGAGRGFFLKPTGKVTGLQKGQPLQWDQDQALEVYVLKGDHPDSRFDLKSWTSSSQTPESWWVEWDPNQKPILKIKSPAN